MNILNKIKDSLQAGNSMFHTGVTLSNAFMHAGTTNDKFFRDNLEWLGRRSTGLNSQQQLLLESSTEGTLDKGRNSSSPTYLRNRRCKRGFPIQSRRIFVLWA
jgi:26S proteasome regulatory subunit N2